MGRSAELEEFLRRVEDYDLQRKGSTVVQGSNDTGTNGVRDGYSDKNLDIARDILANHGVEIVDKESRSSTLEAPELAYQSAYNYERTFSPSRRVSSRSKTYTVSESDYFLLQRLKAKEKPPVPLPSRALPPREKPKDQYYLRSLLGDEKDLSHHNATVSSQLPDRSLHIMRGDGFEKNKNTIPRIDGIPKDEELSSPPLIPKAQTLQKPQAESLEPSGGTGDHLSRSKSPATKSPHKVELKSSPKKFDLKAELGEPTKTISFNDSKSFSSRNEPPLQTDFLDSVQRNKMESTSEKPKFNHPPLKAPSLPFDGFIDSAAQKSPTPPSKPVKPPQLTNHSGDRSSRTEYQDYIGSVLKSSSQQQPSVGNLRANFTLPAKSGTETFIDSVLRTAPQLPPSPIRKTSTVIKPLPVSKPLSLRKSSTAPNDNEIEKLKPVQTTMPNLLKSKDINEKLGPPKVPPKKSELVLPKARQGNHSAPNTDLVSRLKKTEPPQVPKKKPSLPEALARLGSLSKPPPSPERQNEVPEALTKVGQLSKAAPSPKRPYEMPEALTKVGQLSKVPPSPKKPEAVPEALTKVGRLSKVPPSPKKPETVPEALSHLSKLNKVNKQPSISSRNMPATDSWRRSQDLKNQPESSKSPEKPTTNVRSELDEVLMAHKSGKSRNARIPSNNSGIGTSANLHDTDSHTLIHPNKKRSKGPKRRIPSNIKN